MKEKIYENALRFEQITKLTKEEKQKVVNTLLKKSSYRVLSERLGIPSSTLELWAKPDPKHDKMFVNIDSFYKKLKQVDPKKITDWGRLQQIRDLINDLLRKKE